MILAVALLDQLTKLWAISKLSDGLPRQVIGTFFQLKLLYNQGGVMGSSLGGGTFYLISSLFVLGFVIYFLYTYKHIFMVSLPMAFVAGGAIGNIIDRIRFGKVVDFLDFDFFDITFGSFQLDRWWTFNVADAAISVGVVWLIFYILFFSKTAQPEAVKTSPESSSI
jgi:signal peptidase II